MGRMSDRTLAALYDAVEDDAVVARYRALVSLVATSRGCRLWIGAVASKGHGRFWIGSYRDVAADGSASDHDITVISHRFGYALEFGVGALLKAEQVTHLCDETLCQEPTHWRAGNNSMNLTDFHARRATPGSPLRDVRGARGRAVALRDAARVGENVTTAGRAGQPSGDLLQDTLPLG